MQGGACPEKWSVLEAKSPVTATEFEVRNTSFESVTLLHIIVMK